MVDRTDQAKVFVSDLEADNERLRAQLKENEQVIRVLRRRYRLNEEKKIYALKESGESKRIMVEVKKNVTPTQIRRAVKALFRDSPDVSFVLGEIAKGIKDKSGVLITPLNKDRIRRVLKSLVKKEFITKRPVTRQRHNPGKQPDSEYIRITNPLPVFFDIARPRSIKGEDMS